MKDVTQVVVAALALLLCVTCRGDNVTEADGGDLVTDAPEGIEVSKPNVVSTEEDQVSEKVTQPPAIMSTVVASTEGEDDEPGPSTVHNIQGADDTTESPSIFTTQSDLPAEGPALAMSDEKRLTKHLMENYKRVGLVGRPVLAANSSVEVSIGFYLIQIQNFDQYKQILTLTGILKMMWTDPLLKWDPEEFGSVDSVTIPPEDMWTPDIFMFNSVSSPRVVKAGNCWVNSNGAITWVRENQWDLLCETYEEELEPACELRFGSWTLPANKLALKMSQARMDANYYVQNHVYELGKTKAEEQEAEYPYRQGEYYNAVTYSFKLKHRPPKAVEEDDKDSGSSALEYHLGAGLISLLLTLSMH